MIEDVFEISGDDIADAAVAGAFDVTAVDRVPQGKMVSEDEFLLLLNCLWDRLAKKPCDERPEAVLRVAVEEILLTGFDGREASQDEDPGVFVVKGTEGMDDSCVVHDDFLQIV